MKDLEDNPRFSYLREDDPLTTKIVIGLIEWATGRRQLEQHYGNAIRAVKRGETYWDVTMKELGITPEIIGEEKLQDVPKEGPLLIVANHPFGIADGVIASMIIGALRPKFKVLINEVICTERVLDPYFLPIDFRETREASRNNVAARKIALENGEFTLL